MIAKAVVVILFAVVMISCSTTPPVKTAENKTVKNEENKSLPQPAVKIPDKLEFLKMITVKSYSTGDLTTLEKIASGRPILIDFSASWCVPCAELTAKINKLTEQFGDAVAFVMLLKSGDSPPKGEEPQYPVFYLESSPQELKIDNIEVYPKVLIFDKDGEITAELDGLYPGLYYFGVLGELVQ